ncbi:aspartate racemase [Actibacterium mucosum KCTC 23349]|uniref:Aspartate racemase n=1 Tax=Actibacterium mucosum KCTC 23349 TaxID=1454373 RepID=A0A037ZHY2_9RHOB|nr:aspartate/glutamate racemase family protein [Actibacterium mucosum]KAJ55733.1 aspartate racemase [Actibacterium mucosum KCTC 23349]
MHLGLIGGIGVAATIAYYQRLTQAVGGPFDLTIEHGDVQTLIANNLTDARDAQAAIYARHIDRLARAGCDAVAITSLGGHFCFAETQALSALPLISGVEPLDRFFADQGLARVGLLGTRVVMRTRLYGQLDLTDSVALDDQIETLGQTYQDVALSGRCSDAQRATFFAAGRQMVDAFGAQAIVLAGTDLNLAFDGHDPGFRVVDALDVHVDLLAQLIRGDTGHIPAKR